MVPSAVEELIRRSRRLGANPTYTNYGGGNTSVKAAAVDPLGHEREVLYIKGSGGDLGTLQVEGVAALDLGELRGLRSRYPGQVDEDGMAALVELCALRPFIAAPSIDAAMHALLRPVHVDHLHPDSVIALAAAADGEALTEQCFGGTVGWMPWRRPGFELGVRLAELEEAQPDLRGVVLGGHGLTAWGATSAECERTSVELIEQAARFIAERGRSDPFGPVCPGREVLPESERRRRAAELAPHLRGLASRDHRVVCAFNDAAVVTDFLARAEAPRLVELGTSCPDHFLRTKVKPLLLDLPATAELAVVLARAAEGFEEYRAGYLAYYERYATADSPPVRGADPAVVLVPGVGMFSFGPDRQSARVTGAYYINAINVIRGAEALSRYEPIPEPEKFRVEYWALEEAKLRRRPAPKALAGRVALITGGASGIGLATVRTFAAQGACVVVTDRDAGGATRAVKEIAGPDSAIAIELDVCSEDQVARAFEEACLAFGGVDIVVNNAGLSVSKALADTDAESDWDLIHDVLARGSFLVSRGAARVLAAQGLGGDIVYVVSKNSVVAGPANLAYASAKADQAHQVRLLAAELGGIGVRVNGVNPDGVVAGSGIFANGWGAQRAEVYGVAEEALGEYYAQRTLLKREVLPEHVAEAILALVGGLLTRTTGTHIPVDGGIPAAFLR